MKTYSIGRGDENDVVIRDHSVSRNHAELRVDSKGQFQLIDLNSTNGTFVRDGEEWVQIYQAYVAEDERIMFGSTATTVTALLAKKTIEPDGTLTDAAADEEASGTPAKAEATGEEALQGPAGRADNMSLGENADSAAGAFHDTLEHVKSLNKGSRLSREFPDEWTGKRWYGALMRQFVEPHLQAIKSMTFAIGFGGPVLMIAGWALPPVLMVSVALTLFISALLLSIWIPGVIVKPVVRKMSWVLTFTLLLLLAILWSPTVFVS